ARRTGSPGCYRSSRSTARRSSASSTTRPESRRRRRTGWGGGSGSSPRAATICLVNDETGIPATAQDRLEVCKRLVDAVHGRYEVPLEDIVVDPLAMTVGADPQAGLTTPEKIRVIRDAAG